MSDRRQQCVACLGSAPFGPSLHRFYIDELVLIRNIAEILWLLFSVYLQSSCAMSGTMMTVFVI